MQQLKLFQSAKEVSDKMNLTISIQEEKFLFSNHFDDSLAVLPEMFQLQGKAWLQDTLEELVENV